ncbi:hypothetical protein BKA81DRAFT_356185, partial [Phyllosticta paracitricarpa]
MTWPLPAPPMVRGAVCPPPPAHPSRLVAPFLSSRASYGSRDSVLSPEAAIDLPLEIAM